MKYDSIISFDVPASTTVCLCGAKNVSFFLRQDLIKYRKLQYEGLQMSKISILARLFAGWLMEGLCLSRSERVISQCQADIDSLIKRHTFLSNKIRKKSQIQINNINPSWVKESNLIKVTKKKYDVGFVGNFNDDRKGAQILLKAMDILFKQGYKYSVVFVGDGEKLEESKRTYSHLENIKFVGHVSNPLDYIQSMKLMVVPSRSDSCPNTIMEALFVGTAVIGAKSGGIPEILDNDDWLFDPDENSLSKKIEVILQYKKTEELAYAQRSRAKELTFDWGKAIERCLFPELKDNNAN